MRARRGTWFTWVLVCLAAMTGAGTPYRAASALADDTGTGTQQLFEVRYQAWQAYLMEHDVFSPRSDTPPDRYFDNEPFRQIVALGIPAIPTLLAKSQTDTLLAAALTDITKVEFHFRNEILGLRKERWTVDELPGVQWDHDPDDREVWRRWWTQERFHAPERFEKLCAERQALLQQGDAKGAQEKYERIQNLGIPVLPCLLDKIGQGATDLVPILSALTNGDVKPDASPADCAKWWNAHKQEWTLPPAPTEKAK